MSVPEATNSNYVNLSGVELRRETGNLNGRNVEDLTIQETRNCVQDCVAVTGLIGFLGLVGLIISHYVAGDHLIN